MKTFHNEQRELTGYLLDRWDKHGVPCKCDLCQHEYELLEREQLEQDRRHLRVAEEVAAYDWQAQMDHR